MGKNMSDFKKPQRSRNSLDNSKFHLVTKNEKGYRAKFIPELVNNNPRFTIYTGLDEDKDNNYGRIQAKLDAPTFMLIIEQLEDLARHGDGKKIFGVDNMKQVFKDKKPTDEWYAENSVKVGRDDDGQIWISVIEKNRPKLKFILTNPEYHRLKNADGSDLPAGTVSRMYTLAWTGVMRSLIGPCLNSNYVPPKPREDNQQKGGYRGGVQSRSNQMNNSSTEQEHVYDGSIDDELWS